MDVGSALVLLGFVWILFLVVGPYIIPLNLDK